MATEPLTFTLRLPSAHATAAFGAALAARLRPGDTLLLSGPVGAGKSHLARAIIAARLAAAGRQEDIPSPTFTLVQVYDDGLTEIWHADLYRLGHPAEVAELGLHDAMAEAICLVEWPERLPDPPPGALRIVLRPGEAEDSRILTATWAAHGDAGDRWGGRLAAAGAALDGAADG